MKNAKTDITPEARAEIVEALMLSLAESAILTQKAQNFHWNVTGLSFGALHELFEKIYQDHFAGQDDLAERIKALEGFADGRFSEYLKRSSIFETEARLQAPQMIEILKGDEETLSASLRALAEVADQHGDSVTNDLALERAAEHDKFAWMLRAHLDRDA